jgi:hypothetical protein
LDHAAKSEYFLRGPALRGVTILNNTEDGSRMTLTGMQAFSFKMLFEVAEFRCNPEGTPRVPYRRKCLGAPGDQGECFIDFDMGDIASVYSAAKLYSDSLILNNFSFSEPSEFVIEKPWKVPTIEVTLGGIRNPLSIVFHKLIEHIWILPWIRECIPDLCIL